jgi:hypothetical protein
MLIAHRVFKEGRAKIAVCLGVLQREQNGYLGLLEKRGVAHHDS